MEVEATMLFSLLGTVQTVWGGGELVLGFRARGSEFGGGVNGVTEAVFEYPY